MVKKYYLFVQLGNIITCVLFTMEDSLLFVVGYFSVVRALSLCNFTVVTMFDIYPTLRVSSAEPDGGHLMTVT